MHRIAAVVIVIVHQMTVDQRVIVVRKAVNLKMTKRKVKEDDQ